MAASDKLLDLISRTNQTSNPADEINFVPAQATNPALSSPVLSAIQQSGPVAPSSIVDAAAPDGDIADRFGVAGPSMDDQNRTAPVYGGGSLRDVSRRAALSQGETRLAQIAQHQQFEEQLGLANLALQQRKEEAEAAKRHLDVISKTAELTDTAKKHADTAGFIAGLSQTPHDSPDYDAQLGALAAQFSRAEGKSLEAVLASKNAARDRHLKGMEAGGAAEFAGPAQTSYLDTFKSTGDIYQARAAAKATQENEKAIQQFLKDGTLTADDLMEPGKGALDKNGNVDYERAKTIAAQRQGEATGKPVTAADRDIQHSKSFIEAYAKNPDALDNDPRLKELYNIHVAKVLNYEKSKNPTAVTPAPTAQTYTQF